MLQVGDFTGISGSDIDAVGFDGICDVAANTVAITDEQTNVKSNFEGCKHNVADCVDT